MATRERDAADESEAGRERAERTRTCGARRRQRQAEAQRFEQSPRVRFPGARSRADVGADRAEVGADERGHRRCEARRGETEVDGAAAPVAAHERADAGDRETARDGCRHRGVQVHDERRRCRRREQRGAPAAREPVEDAEAA